MTEITWDWMFFYGSMIFLFVVLVEAWRRIFEARSGAPLNSTEDIHEPKETEETEAQKVDPYIKYRRYYIEEVLAHHDYIVWKNIGPYIDGECEEVFEQPKSLTQTTSAD